MKDSRKLLNVIALGLLGAACTVAQPAIGAPERARSSARGSRMAEVDAVAARLVGAMDSSAQARKDPDYRDVRITHCRVRISDAPAALTRNAVFVYVEQTMTMMLDKPYRQRFLRLSPGPGGKGVLSSVYEPPEPQRFIGLCSRPPAEQTLRAADLGASDCSVLLHKDGSRYVGETQEGGCPSTFRGATRVTSKVTLFEGGMDSLDQGWDAQGRQVWGAEKGPYQFRTVNIPFSRDVMGPASPEEFARWISGRWSTEEQARRDGRYMGFVENFCTFQLQEASGASEQLQEASGASEVYLYVDKAAAAAVSTPFRQQAVAVRAQADGTLEYRVFDDMKDRTRFTSFGDRPAAARVVAPEELGAYRCSLVVRKGGEAYLGITGPDGCPGKFGSATRATTTITLYEDGLMLASTRAFDSEGRQVWGIPGAPFEMRKVHASPGN